MNRSKARSLDKRDEGQHNNRFSLFRVIVDVMMALLSKFLFRSMVKELC